MFCLLDSDVKTFDYFNRYVACFDETHVCLDLDNRIQVEEMDNHLRSNGFALNDSEERLRWISLNARPFREYLNSIKLVYVMCKVMEIDPHTLTVEKFHELECKLNSLRHCLVSIF